MATSGFDVNDELIDVDIEYEDTDFLYQPEELQEKMGRAAYEFAYANRQLRDLEIKRKTREQQTRIIILSKRLDLIQNQALKAHLEVCISDPKFKATKEDLYSFCYMEHRQIFELYTKFEQIAKQANREFEMWQSQLIWYQSKMKQAQNELKTLGLTT